MDIILKDDFPGLGHKNDIITVKDGYGRNFLIPKGFAILATATTRKIHTENLRQRAHKEEKIKNKALDQAKKLEDISMTIGAKTSTKGKIFGSVNPIQISEALEKAGFEIDRKKITLKDDPIKEIGKYVANIKLHREVEVEIEFEIVSE